MTKMMPLAGAVQLATVLITANAAWCQSSDSSSVLNYTTSTINRFDDRLGLKSTVPMRVREAKVGAWDAVKAGFLMAVAREPFSNVWPSYAYEADPSIACKFLTDGMAEDAFILASRVELGAAAHRDSDSLEVDGIPASSVCGSNASQSQDDIVTSFSNVWPSYAYEADPSIACKFLTDGMAEDAFILASRVELGAAAHRDSDSLEVDGIPASNICNTETDSPVPSPESNTWAWQWKQGTYYYIMADSPVPSLELSARIWREKQAEQDTYYYIMADIPVPSLALSARVWREKLNIYDYFITAASHDP